MQLMKSNYEFKAENYHKPTPVKLKYIADFMLVLIPVIDGLALQVPEFPAKQWVLFAWSAFAVIFKMATKFISDYRAEIEPILDNTIPAEQAKEDLK